MGNISATIMNFVARLQRLRSEDGQTLAEYSLIVTLVAVGVTVAAVLLFQTALAGAYTGVANCLLTA